MNQSYEGPTLLARQDVKVPAVASVGAGARWLFCFVTDLSTTVKGSVFVVGGRICWFDLRNYGVLSYVLLI